MDKNIELIEKLFKISFSPLTCEISYKKKQDIYVLLINEIVSSNHYYNLSFESCNFTIIDNGDSFYQPFDDFLPNLANNILIQTKRRDFRTKGSLYYLCNELRGKMTLSASGVTYTNYQTLV